MTFYSLLGDIIYAHFLFATIFEIIVITISFIIFIKLKNNKLKFLVVTILLLLTVLSMTSSYNEIKNAAPEKYPLPVVLSDKKDLDPYIISNKKRIIELDYPEFKDFENQESFAGQSIKIIIDNGEYYFAYIVQGSGLPIAKATCFRTDSLKAYKIGEFPNPADSYSGYTNVDPKTCKGIK